MDWQLTCVYLILALAIGYTIYHIVRAFQQKAFGTGCAHCDGSCQIKPLKNKSLQVQK